jgi:hypothetical protein
VESLVFNDKVHGFQRFFLSFRREADDDLNFNGYSEIYTVIRDPPDPFLLDSLLHEIHDALIEGLQPEDDLQTPGITH